MYSSIGTNTSLLIRAHSPQNFHPNRSSTQCEQQGTYDQKAKSIEGDSKNQPKESTCSRAELPVQQRLTARILLLRQMSIDRKRHLIERETKMKIMFYTLIL